MKIHARRYTSGRIALASLSSTIEGLERRRADGAGCDDLVALSKLLFLRGDLLGRIADHDRAETVAEQAAAASPDVAGALLIRARLAERFHRFEEGGTLLDGALAAGGDSREIRVTRASMLQATGRFQEALALREALAREDRGIHTLCALATLLAEMDQWNAAETLYAEALDADDRASPLPCAQLLFEWGVSAMRRGELERAEQLFGELEAILPGHVPGRGHRAEVALARGRIDVAAALIEPLLDTSDDPEYRGIHAEVLAARGDHAAAASQAQLAADEYESLLARRPQAYADHAAAFFMGIGNRPRRAVDLALMNRLLRDTPRSRRLLARAQRCASAPAGGARGAAPARATA
jgi:tetratricopeptide (TPR) repeat protein